MLADGARPSLAISGGTIVYARMNNGELRDQRIVDISRIDELSNVAVGATRIEIGAAVTYARLLELSPHPLLQQVLEGITGGPQILNQGTPAGSACFGNPSSDIPTALVALKAQLTLTSAPNSIRMVSAADFFIGPFQTARRSDELLTAISFPRASSSEGWGYCKLKFGESSWPIAVGAARVSSFGAGSSLAVDLTIGAATETPIVFSPLMAHPDERRGMSKDLEVRLRHAVRTVSAAWWKDELADAGYRQRVSEAIAVRAVQRALAAESIQ